VSRPCVRVAALPQARSREGEQRQRPTFALDRLQHLPDQTLVLERVAALERGLDQGAAQGIAGGRSERNEPFEDRPQRPVLLAAQQEVVPDREQDVDVRLEDETREQGREARLHIGWIQGEQLLELVDDDQRFGMVTSPAAEQVDRDVGVLEPQHLAHGVGVARDLRDERLPEGDERGVARRADEVRPPFGLGRDQSCTQETALACSGGTDNRQEVPPRQLLPHLLDFGLSPEEVLRFRLGEGGESGVRLCLVDPRHPVGDLLQGARERLRGGVTLARFPGDRSLDRVRPRGVGDLRGILPQAKPERTAGFRIPCSTRGDHLRQDDAGREDVRARVRGGPRRLLRRPVRRRAGDGAARRHRLRDAEVHQHDPPRPGPHDVLRLDVPVN